MLRTVFHIEGVDKGSNGIHGKDIAEDLAQFVHPQKGKVESKEMKLPGCPRLKLGNQIEGGGR